MFYQLSSVILNTSVDLLTLRPFTILINFSFSLSLWRTFPCWYVSQTIFFSLLLIISSNSQITDVVSSHFCILSAFSSICFNFFIKFLFNFFFGLSYCLAVFRNPFQFFNLKLKKQCWKGFKKSNKNIAQKSNHQF